MSTTINKKSFVVFQGHQLFRYRIICSLLSVRPIRIEGIRADDNAPGITDSEANFLELIEAITNGSVIKVNDTGTTVMFRPGVILGGGPLTHVCKGTRSIGWYMEALACLLPFAKEQTTINIQGITNDGDNQTVDAIRTVTLPLLRHFGVEEGLEFRVLKRGAPPLGGGEVSFVCPVVRALKPINLLDEGKIKRIRGIAFTTRVSPQIGNRVVESARSLVNCFLPDVYIYTDHFKGAESGLSPGYGVCLVAESNSGVNLSAEVMGGKDTSPEEVGVHAAKLLCNQIRLGGCVDTSNQAIVLLHMCLGPEDVSKVRLGKLSQHTIEILRLLREMFGVKFKIKPDGNTVVLSCLGIGFTNIAKASS